MLSVATTSQIRKLESDWIARSNARWGQVLMELAGSSAATVAYGMLADLDDGTTLVLCGNGNNGGDGLVVARFLSLWKIPVEVWVLNKKGADDRTSQKMTSEEANANLAIAKEMGIAIHFFDQAADVPFEDAVLIVDALLGTGIDRPVEGLYRDLIEHINDSDLPILSIDLPSGVNSDTGQIMGVAVKASQTVTFGYLKCGLLCHPAAELCGTLSLIDIGLPELGVRSPKIWLTSVEHVRRLLPERSANSNKGTFGTVLTIAGSLGMSGATLLSSESSLKAGCGLSLLATPKSLVASLPPEEVIYRPVSETEKMSIHPNAIIDLQEDLKRASALVLGPGMSTHEETVEFVREFVSITLAQMPTLPCVIDADALNAIAQNPGCIPGSPRHPFVLTPHPKELSRLTGIDTSEIQADRINHAIKAAQQFSCVVLLKGANTVIADPDGIVFVNPTGNPAMAKAGAGDVLSGIIGGLLAQGLAPLDAAVAGAYIHGRAGDLAAQIHGARGVVAGDISLCIPEALNTILDGKLSPFEEHLEENLTALR
jgi:ADP-dependent NAD(P)H-hydrate dehydratase / NAD(P)H-hydrate epimerase